MNIELMLEKCYSTLNKERSLIIADLLEETTNLLDGNTNVLELERLQPRLEYQISLVDAHTDDLESLYNTLDAKLIETRLESNEDTIMQSSIGFTLELIDKQMKLNDQLKVMLFEAIGKVISVRESLKILL